MSWSEVVVSENTLSKESGWGKIFNIKSKEEPKPEDPKTKVKIEWDATKGYKLGDAKSFTQINNLGTLGQLVDDLKDKTVTEFKGDFTLKFNDTNVNICVGGNIDIKSGENFKKLLGYVKTLKDTHKAISDDFKIKITPGKKTIMLNENAVASSLIVNATFWDAVKNHKELFGGLPIKVVRDSTINSNKGKIGKKVIEVEMFNGEDIAEGWQEIFKKK